MKKSWSVNNVEMLEIFFSEKMCKSSRTFFLLHINIIVVNFHCILPWISIHRLPRKLAPRSISCIEKLSNFITLGPMNEHYHSVKWSQKNWSGKRETFPLCLRQWRHHFLLLFMIFQTIGEGEKSEHENFFHLFLSSSLIYSFPHKGEVSFFLSSLLPSSFCRLPFLTLRIVKEQEDKCMQCRWKVQDEEGLRIHNF